MKHTILVRDFTQDDDRALEKMLVTYFLEDLELTLEREKVIEQVAKPIYQSWLDDIVLVAIATVSGEAVGFSVYQVDTLKSDWCKKEGWGFMREVYIAKEYRKQGIGTTLTQYCERKLYQMGVENIYLTADDAIVFWENLGYTQTVKKGLHDTTVLIK